MSDLVESCKEFVRRIAGSLIELGSVRVCQENCKVTKYAECRKGFVRRITRCLIELGRYKELLMRIARCLI